MAGPISADELVELGNLISLYDSRFDATVFSENSEWIVRNVAQDSAGVIEICLERMPSGQSLILHLHSSDYPEPEIPEKGIRVSGRVFDMSVALMEFAGDNELEEFSEGQVLRLLPGFRVIQESP